MENGSKQQQIIDFFKLEAPKPIKLEDKIKYIIIVSSTYPLLNGLFHLGWVAHLPWIFILLITYLFYLNPRKLKQKKYDLRISPYKLNNWLLERCKTKILNRAIDYLEIETKDMAAEQFIVIPYPVFHQTPKIDDGFILREKATEKPNIENNSTSERDFYYCYSYWNIQILILSKSYISFYFCGYNFLTDEIINERSNEYFYQDVATIKTETNEVQFPSKWHEEPITEARITKIIHNSGDILKLVTEIPALKQPPKTIVDIEKIEKAIRMLLRHTRDIDESRKMVNIQFKQETAREEVLDVD